MISDLIKAAAAQADLFEQVYPQILKREGGPDKITHDTGGTTKGGIAETSGLSADKIRALTPDGIKQQWRQRWDQSGAKFKNPGTAELFFDMHGNMNPAQATKYLQRNVNALRPGAPQLAEDGVFGSGTAAAANEVSQSALSKRLYGSFRQHHADIAKNRPTTHGKYLNGWNNRTAELAKSPNIAPLLASPVLVKGTLQAPQTTSPVLVKGTLQQPTPTVTKPMQSLPQMQMLGKQASIGQLVKTAAEMKRKTTMVESHSDHCPHCDFEFGEKCHPVVKDKGERVTSIDKVYKTGEYDEHCPACDGILDQKERSDEEIDGDSWLAFPGSKEQARARRDAQRRRKAEREGHEKKADMWIGDEATEKKLRTEELARARKDPDYVTKFKGTRRGTWPEVAYAISVLEREQEGQEKTAMVKQEGHEWILYTADGERVLGRHTSAKKAYAQEYAIKKSQESKMEKQALRPIAERMQRLRDRRGECYTCGKPNREGRVCDCGTTKEASRTKEIQELLDDSDIPSDIYFFTDGKERATVCIGDWHEDTEGDIAIQFGMANWDNFERPDDTEIGKPSWATMTLSPRRKGLSKKASIASLLRQARNATHEHPTEAQRRAGNYRHGKLTIHGLRISIENPKDSIRRGKDKNGKPWANRLAGDYGFFTGSKAIDGDAIDVFIGEDLDSEFVTVIDQYFDGKFDESKFVICCDSQAKAEKIYLDSYQKGWKLGDVSTTTVQQLKEWLKDGDHKKPFKGQLVKAAAWWHPKKPHAAAKPADPTALRYLPGNLKDLLAVTFGSKWATKEERQRKQR